MSEDKISCFNPVIYKDSTVLILGSMPSVESIRQQQYYGNKNNQFWKILISLFDHEMLGSYPEKIEFLKENKIALWDVLKDCERKGSLDKDITNESPNDILRLLEENPQITRIFCNGTKSYKSLMKYFPEISKRIECAILPSSSPAYTIKFEEKLERWKVITAQ